jgi:hypothetical protein
MNILFSNTENKYEVIQHFMLLSKRREIMSEYRLEINGTIGLSDYSNINDYLNIIGENDKVTIAVDSGEAHNVDIITNILRRGGFEVTLKGSHDDARYYITAFKQGDEFKA